MNNECLVGTVVGVNNLDGHHSRPAIVTGVSGGRVVAYIGFTFVNERIDHLQNPLPGDFTLVLRESVLGKRGCSDK